MSSDLFRPGPGQNIVIANIRETCALTPVFLDSQFFSI